MTPTTRHAIQYLRQARDLVQQATIDRKRLSQWDALASLEPGVPCAAYGMAKDAFRHARDLPIAIRRLGSKGDA
ncbi:hypothetical protein [Candidimonas nitroreducens]|uniref:Uncharacterized protein n=1 Tax=Candidimonas nitroreducens TaxID=683354 RepID=A0A225MRA2_9BURK|nr:hypothetical protein [Candidimonas nitroreducens]OWT62001.1 hypothetical protein CEY11_09335 [Candidimonas nitroreducens]